MTLFTKHAEYRKYYDAELNLHCIIAVDSEQLGPAVGGIRMQPYPDERAMLEDVLLLSGAMTKKCVMAGVDHGGGKTVILGDPEKDWLDEELREKMLMRVASWIHEWDGRYIGGEDMGIGVSDIEKIGTRTPYVAGLPEDSQLRRGSGDPSRMTAYGVYGGIKVGLAFKFGMSSLPGKKIAIQGAAGKVGRELLKLFLESGQWVRPAEIIITDLRQKGLDELTELYSEYPGLRVLPADERESIYDERCHIFVPCARGNILNFDTIDRLDTAGYSLVAGCANNQLDDPDRNARQLHRLGILYAPDFAINAGGLINITEEMDENGYDEERARAKTDNITQKLREIFERSDRDNRPPSFVAEDMVQEKLREKAA